MLNFVLSHEAGQIPLFLAWQASVPSERSASSRRENSTSETRSKNSTWDLARNNRELKGDTSNRPAKAGGSMPDAYGTRNVLQSHSSNATPHRHAARKRGDKPRSDSTSKRNSTTENPSCCFVLKINLMQSGLTGTMWKRSPLGRLSSRLGSRCSGSSSLFQINSRTKTSNLRGNGQLVSLVGRSAEPRLILFELDGVLAAAFFFAISFGARHVETLLGENRIGNHRDQRRSTVQTEMRTQGESS